MDKKREAFEASNNVSPDWSFKFDEELQQYVATDFEMTNQVEEFNEHWDTFRAGWQAAKAQAIPDGFVVVPKEPTKEMIHIGESTHYGYDNIDSKHCYIAMIVAAQEPDND